MISFTVENVAQVSFCQPKSVILKLFTDVIYIPQCLKLACLSRQFDLCEQGWLESSLAGPLMDRKLTPTNIRLGREAPKVINTLG